ncbi:MAG: isoprenyl transferase [Ignavibacteriae bacterium]|nr:isoprenyl transferase [Ignavibacteriota bacterium]NOG97013.1 isoprenyl transferase [Ignavibacteriota bacterium]
MTKFADESTDVPRHIAIIMDGNGRWAKRRGLPRVAGHKKGVETVREIVEACAQLGVSYLTIYTFSTENWKRPKNEVSTLMRLIVKSLQTETNDLHANNIKLTTIGNTDALPSEVRDELNQAIEKTKNNKRLTLNLALSYSGRWELTEAIKSISTLYKNKKVDLDEITEKLVSEHLSTKGMPDPDLLIRSGGEYRISNFLLWQIAYSEIYVTKVLWPEFRYTKLIEAIKDYQKRERRFGLVSEQISEKDDINTQTEKKQTGKVVKV